MTFLPETNDLENDKQINEFYLKEFKATYQKYWVVESFGQSVFIDDLQYNLNEAEIPENQEIYLDEKQQSQNNFNNSTNEFDELIIALSNLKISDEEIQQPQIRNNQDKSEIEDINLFFSNVKLDENKQVELNNNQSSQSTSISQYSEFSQDINNQFWNKQQLQPENQTQQYEFQYINKYQREDIQTTNIQQNNNRITFKAFIQKNRINRLKINKKKNNYTQRERERIYLQN